MLSDAQKKIRMQGLGGSDAAAVLGLNPYKDAAGVWLDKTGREPSFEPTQNDPMYWGNILESVILDEYEKVAQTAIERDSETLIHPGHNWMLAHLDGFIPEEKKIVECKTSNAFMRDHWGPAGTDMVPEQYLIQVQHYMAVTGYISADIVVLIGGNDFRIYTVQRDDALITEMIRRLSQFWHFHVLADLAPDPTSKDSAAHLWKKDNGQCVIGNQDDVTNIEALKSVKHEIKNLNKQKEKLETHVVNRLGEASALKVDDALIATWRANKNGRRVLRIN